MRNVTITLSKDELSLLADALVDSTTCGKGIFPCPLVSGHPGFCIGGPAAEFLK